MFCKKCGAEIKENAKFCIKCGCEVNTEPKMPGDNKQVADMKADNGDVKSPKNKKSKKVPVIISVCVVVTCIVGCLIVAGIRRGNTKSIMSAYASFYEKYCEENYEESSLKVKNDNDENYVESVDCAGKVVMEGERPLLVIADMKKFDEDESKFDLLVYEFNGLFVKERTVLEDVKGNRNGILVFSQNNSVYVYSDSEKEDSVFKLTKNSFETVKDMEAYVNNINIYCDDNLLYRIYDGTGCAPMAFVKKELISLLQELAKRKITNQFQLDCAQTEYMMDEEYNCNYRIVHWEDGLCYAYSSLDILEANVKNGYSYDGGSGDSNVDNEYETYSIGGEDAKNLLLESHANERSVYKYIVDGTEHEDKEKAASELDSFYKESDYTIVGDYYSNVYDAYDVYCAATAYQMPDKNEEKPHFIVIDYDPQSTEFIVKETIQNIPVVGVHIESRGEGDKVYLQIPDSLYNFAVTCENIVFCCAVDSYAEQYANASGVPYLLGTIEEKKNEQPIVSGIKKFKNEVFDKYIEMLGPSFEDFVFDFALVDINGDGIPEMFSSGMDEVHQMFYVDEFDRIGILEANAGCFLHNPDDNILIAKSFTLGIVTSTKSEFYQYEEKKLTYTKIHTVDVQEE